MGLALLSLVQPLEHSRCLYLLVGSQVRVRVAVVDNFGIETNLYSQATRTVENVNNKPSGRIVIRRVGQ